MEPGIEITIESDREEYAPGDTLTGRVTWNASDSEHPAELSVLWYTEGKGDMDSGVVHFEEISLNDRNEQGFDARLPLLPLTYYGNLLKIHWTVRVRVDKKWGRDLLFELPFVLRSSPAGPKPETDA